MAQNYRTTYSRFQRFKMERVGYRSPSRRPRVKPDPSILDGGKVRKNSKWRRLNRRKEEGPGLHQQFFRDETGVSRVTCCRVDLES